MTQTRTMRGMNAQGEITEMVVAFDPAVAAARKVASDERRAWRERKEEAQTELSATDYLALPDRRAMTDAEKAYREALRAIIRAEPKGTAPELPTL